MSLPRLLGIGVLILIVPASAFAVAINSDVGLTPFKGQWIYRSQLRYTKKADDPTPQDRKLETFVMPQTLVYGVTEKASVILTIPFVSKELDSTTEGLRTSRGDAGLGISCCWASIGSIPRITQRRPLGSQSWPGRMCRPAKAGMQMRGANSPVICSLVLARRIRWWAGPLPGRAWMMSGT